MMERKALTVMDLAQEQDTMTQDRLGSEATLNYNCRFNYTNTMPQKQNKSNFQHTCPAVSNKQPVQVVTN